MFEYLFVRPDGIEWPDGQLDPFPLSWARWFNYLGARGWEIVGMEFEKGQVRTAMLMRDVDKTLDPLNSALAKNRQAERIPVLQKEREGLK